MPACLPDSYTKQLHTCDDAARNVQRDEVMAETTRQLHLVMEDDRRELKDHFKPTFSSTGKIDQESIRESIMNQTDKKNR